MLGRGRVLGRSEEASSCLGWPKQRSPKEEDKKSVLFVFVAVK
jgi:hypothetical protein